MKVIRLCEICGREFAVSTEYSPQKICLSDDCIRERDRRYKSKYNKISRESRKNREQHPQKVDVGDIAKLARAAGMSYGQYMAVMKFNRMRGVCE